MRATLISISVILGICMFVTGCEKGSASLYEWPHENQVVGEYDYEYDYGYDYEYEEGYYDCEEDYYADNGYYDGEYNGEYYGEYGEYADFDYVAYDTCEHGYWYRHDDCGYSD